MFTALGFLISILIMCCVGMALSGVTDGLKAAKNSSGSTIGRGCAVTITDGNMTLCTSDGTIPNVTIDGITVNDVPDGLIGDVAYRPGTQIKVLLGGTVVKGDLCMPTTAGAWIKSTTTHNSYIRALEGGDSGNYILAEIYTSAYKS